MSETTVSPKREVPASDAPPPFDPDDELMADLEGSRSAVKAYKREAKTLREAAASR
jgi:hypothetical protein